MIILPFWLSLSKSSRQNNSKGSKRQSGGIKRRREQKTPERWSDREAESEWRSEKVNQSGRRKQGACWDWFYARTEAGSSEENKNICLSPSASGGHCKKAVRPRGTRLSRGGLLSSMVRTCFCTLPARWERRLFKNAPCGELKTSTKPIQKNMFTAVSSSTV